MEEEKNLCEGCFYDGGCRCSHPYAGETFEVSDCMEDHSNFKKDTAHKTQTEHIPIPEEKEG